jgi:methanogenic corrinoid protein MtbC1
MEVLKVVQTIPQLLALEILLSENGLRDMLVVLVSGAPELQ